MNSNIIQTRREGELAIITIDRAAEGNMLTVELLGELSAAFRNMGGTDAKVVVLRSTGTDFCRGRDAKGARSAPTALARSSDIHSTAAAPSTMPEELPAWCTWLRRSISGCAWIATAPKPNARAIATAG